MRKNLLLTLFALVCTVVANAQATYVYTADGRVKITGDNIITNGDFSDGTNGWFSSDGAAGVDADTWSVEAGLGPKGENVLLSKGANADAALCNAWTLEPGTYVVSYWVKGDAYQNTSITMTDGAFPNNYLDFYLTTNGGGFNKSLIALPDTMISVAQAGNYTSDWKQVAFSFTVDAYELSTQEAVTPGKLVMHFEKLTTNTMVTCFELRAADVVSDDRIILKKIAYVNDILANENFTPDAEDENGMKIKSSVEQMVSRVKGMLDAGQLDNPATAQSMITAFDNLVKSYMDIKSTDVADLIPGLNIANLSTWGRGGAYSANYKLDLKGGNWGHLATEQDVLRSAIQTGYGNYTATYAAFNEDFPAGKYYFAADIRNANTGKGSWPCDPLSFNLTTEGCKMFIVNDTIDLPLISGEDYQSFSMISEVAEDGVFRAGVFWPGTTNGGAFQIKNTVVRVFDKEINDKIKHIDAWKTFIAQYNAAVNGQKGVWNLVKNGNYPWGQDSLHAALVKWDPYLHAIKAKGWVNEEGKDAGVASTDELNDWAQWQGVTDPSTLDDPTSKDNDPLRWLLVRGYQNASKYVTNLNAPFTDLAAAIDEAKTTRNKGTNATGDRETFKTAIEKAINTINTVRAATTDDTRVADSTALANAKVELEAAVETFLASAVVQPAISIDFANDFELVTPEDDGIAPYYVIKGAAGEMKFADGSVDLEHGDGTGIGPKLGYAWSLGYGDEALGVLHVGSPEATVALPEIPEGGMVVVSFDFWGGYLNKCWTTFALKNAAGTEVAKIQRWNSQGTSSSTFGVTKDDLDKYISTKGGKTQNNAQIYTDANNKSSVSMTIDYKNKTQKLTVVNSNAGTLDAPAVALVPEGAAEDFDSMITSFSLSSNYSSQNNSARRSWFDNLKIYVYGDAPEDFEEDILTPHRADTSAIQEVANKSKANAGAIYSITGVRLNAVPQKGMYIMNGKKYVVK